MATLTIAKPAAAPVVPEDYLELVRKFPLRPIRSGAEHRAAAQMLDQLVGRTLTRGQRDYVAALARFVEEYEREQKMGVLEELSPIEVLRHLMEENQMTTTDLGYIVGSRGLASEILSGKRGLSKRIIARLSERFQVGAAIFLSTVDS